MSELGNIRKKKREDEGINVTPLVDMIFILLIFFIVTTTFVKDLKVDIERPGAKSGENIDERSIRVAVAIDGSVFVNGNPVNSWMVQSSVSSLLDRDSSVPVLIVADRRIETGVLIDIVDQCRLAGAINVGVDVERK